MSVGVDILLDTEKTRLITLLGVNTWLCSELCISLHLLDSQKFEPSNYAMYADPCVPVSASMYLDRGEHSASFFQC
jgi:hypothetical protein